MTDFTAMLQTSSGWLFFPTALLLGALHGLEPGHSKTMMAALIAATRGTPLQAALLGLSAAFSHTLVIWVLAALGLYFGGAFRAEEIEPYFQMISAAFILCFAGWLFLRTREDLAHAEEHDHDHDHEDGHDHEHSHDHGTAHERAHARQFEAAFANRRITTPQIVLFGLTGGLMPCPAALTVLLVCLQLERFSLGFALVGAFSLGLALVLVGAGVAAAWSMKLAGDRVSGFNDWLRRAPYLSCAVLLAVGLYIGWHGAHSFL